MKTREDFHKLIDRIEDESVLRSYLNLIETLNHNQAGILWKQLAPQEQEELLLSYEESFNKENLLGHEQVKKQHDKWLGK